MKRKIIMLTTVTILAFAMTACGNENKEVENPTTESTVDSSATPEPTVTEAPTPEPTATPEPTPTAPIEIDVSSVVRKDLENYRWEMLEIDYGNMLENKSLYEDDAEATEELAAYQQMTQEERIMYVVTDLDKLSYALDRENDNTWVISFYIEMLTENLEPALYEVRTENNWEFLYGENAEKAEKAMLDVVCGYNMDYDVASDTYFVKSYPTGKYAVEVLVERSTGKVYPYAVVVETRDVAAPNDCHEWSETGPWMMEQINDYLEDGREPQYYK